MKASEALRKHADRLESGELRWVRRTPVLPAEACIAYLGDGDDYNHNISSVHPEASRWLTKAIYNNRHRCVGFSHWNDNICLNTSDAVALIREAAVLAEEVGD